MGIPFSLLGKMGFSIKPSMLTDKIFDQFFNKDIRTFEDFHITFLDVCNKFNSTMLGDHYDAPKLEKMKEYYEKWDTESDAKKRKELLIELLINHVDISQTDHSVVLTGLVAPPAAMILKKTGDNLPPLKKFRFNLVPDYIFVPTFTLLALTGVKVFNQMKLGNKADAK